MHWVNRLKDDRGAAATVFFLLAGSGFLFVLLAMTSDASALYRERRITQQAADATSLALASYCALGSDICTNSSSLLAKAKEFADSNSDDGLSDVDSICGTTPMTPCANQAVVSCKTTPGIAQKFARVVVSTKNPDGRTAISSPFLGALLGEENLSFSAKACSQSTWGKANLANVPLPLAITICDYKTDGFKILREYGLQPDRTYTPQLPACRTEITDVQGQRIEPQPRNVINGWTIIAPSGQQPVCLQPQRLVIGMTVETLPPGQERCSDPELGGSTSRQALLDFISNNLGKKVFIPVIASTSGSGNGNAQVVSAPVVGFFTFIFLGYDFGPEGAAGCGATTCSQFAGESATQCGSKNSCVWGQFTRGIVPGVPVSRDTTFPSIGAQAIELLP